MIQLNDDSKTVLSNSFLQKLDVMEVTADPALRLTFYGREEFELLLFYDDNSVLESDRVLIRQTITYLEGAGK